MVESVPRDRLVDDKIARQSVEEIPTCPCCRIPMRKRPTMSGHKWLCDNYHKCGGIKKIKHGNN